MTGRVAGLVCASRAAEGVSLRGRAFLHATDRPFSTRSCRLLYLQIRFDSPQSASDDLLDLLLGCCARQMARMWQLEDPEGL